MRLSGTSLIRLVLAAPIVVMAVACNSAPPRQQELHTTMLEAELIRLEPRLTAGYTELTGTVSGSSRVSLSTKLMSQIIALPVVEGQRVKAGELLVSLDDSEIQAMRNEAAAFRAEAAAALAEVETVVLQSEAGRIQAQAAVAQAEAALADAKRELERATRLVDEDVLPRVQKEKAELGVTLAEESLGKAHAAVTQAEAAVEQARSRKPQVEAKELQAAARDQQAAALQDYTALRAPFDGVVTGKHFETGQLAIPGQPILTLEALGGYKVELGIPEHLAVSLKPGAELTVLVDQPDGIARELSGRLSVLGAAADPASHLVSAELQLTETSGLLSGQFVRIRVPAGKREVLEVPAEAIQTDGELSAVWRVTDGGLVSRVAVELGERHAGMVEIVRGLSAGDVVLSDPPPGIHAGARIAGAVPDVQAAHEGGGQ